MMRGWRCGILVLSGIVLCTPGAALAQAAKKPATKTPQNSQKVANPLNELLDQAQRALDQKDFQAALEPLNKFIAEQPDVAFGHFQLAYAYTGLQRWEEAQGEYRRAIALDPKLTAAYLNLGLILLDRDPAAALEPLREAAERLPAESRPRYLYGLALERAGRLADALESYQTAERLDARDYEVEFALGRTLLRLERAAEAEKKFRAAIELHGDAPPAWLGLATSLLSQNKPEAAAAYRAYLERKPADGEARGQLAKLLFEQKEYSQALAELDSAEKQGPPSAGLLTLRADIYVAQGRWDEAIGTLRKALERAPRDAVLRAGFGRLYLQKREFAAAEKELRTALSMDAQNKDALRDLGSTYYLAGKYPAALQVLDLLARREEPTAGVWFIRAICYDKLERKAEALEAYEKFLALDTGRNPDQVFQAQQRVKLLRRMLEPGKK